MKSVFLCVCMCVGYQFFEHHKVLLGWCYSASGSLHSSRVQCVLYYLCIFISYTFLMKSAQHCLLVIIHYLHIKYAALYDIVYLISSQSHRSMIHVPL